MKLYYSAGSCSTACHITLEESGLKYEAVEVDWDNTSDPNIALVEKLNPLGTLPILVTESGKQLDQNIAIQTYIADLAPDTKLLPTPGTFERAEAMNWLAFVSTDLHKSVGAFFSIKGISTDPAVQTIYRKFLIDNANKVLTYLDSKLANKEYLMGNTFTPADAYAFIVTGWTQWLDIPITPYKNIQNFRARVAARPAVAKVLKQEGLT